MFFFPFSKSVVNTFVFMNTLQALESLQRAQELADGMGTKVTSVL